MVYNYVAQMGLERYQRFDFYYGIVDIQSSLRAALDFSCVSVWWFCNDCRVILDVSHWERTLFF